MSDLLSVKVEGGGTYEKKNLLNISRYETDTAKLCEVKFVRRRHWLFGEKVVMIHWKGGDDYYINDL